MGLWLVNQIYPIVLLLTSLIAFYDLSEKFRGDGYVINEVPFWEISLTFFAFSEIETLNPYFNLHLFRSSKFSSVYLEIRRVAICKAGKNFTTLMETLGK